MAFGLASPSKNGVDAARDYQYTPKGKYTGAEGFLAYYEICKRGLTVVEKNKANAPYGYKDKDWVEFDNLKSLLYKIDNVVKKNSLRRVMFWAIDLDDFSGQHGGQGKYPLMNAVKKYLTSGVQPLSCNQSSTSFDYSRITISTSHYPSVTNSTRYNPSPAITSDDIPRRRRQL